MMTKIYPRTGDKQTVYLNAVVKDPRIEVGDYTIYNDFVADPLLFEKNNVLYHYPIHQERLVIGKFCSIACGTKFLFNCANHTLKSLSTYTFPLFYEEWGLKKSDITDAWDDKGDIIIGNDVWIGYEPDIYFTKANDYEEDVYDNFKLTDYLKSCKELSGVEPYIPILRREGLNFNPGICRKSSEY